jgi:hypothetical protein
VRVRLGRILWQPMRRSSRAPTPVEAAARQLLPAAVEAGYSAPVPELRAQPDEAVEAGGSVGAIVV